MSERYLSINSIYKATEGEGINIGRPQVFVRFQGCFVGCVNCDSKDTWAFSDSDQDKWTLTKAIDEIWSLSGEGSLTWISITGGDPLHPKNVPGVEALTKELKKTKCSITPNIIRVEPRLSNTYINPRRIRFL